MSDLEMTIPDGVVLMYCKDGVLYPTVLDEEKNEILQITARLFSPLKVIFDRPQGRVIKLTTQRPDVATIQEHGEKLQAVINEIEALKAGEDD